MLINCKEMLLSICTKNSNVAALVSIWLGCLGGGVGWRVILVLSSLEQYMADSEILVVNLIS